MTAHLTFRTGRIIGEQLLDGSGPRTGQVSVNGGAMNLSAPFGGYKQSGNGRELGRYGIEEFTEFKSINR